MGSMGDNFNSVSNFAEQAHMSPNSLAVQVGKEQISYGELASVAGRIASYVQPHLKTKRIGVLGSRSITAYVGIIAAGWAGAAYVPLNLKWPEQRLVDLFDELQLDALIVDHNGAKLMSKAVLAHAPNLIFRPHDAVTFAGGIGFDAVDALPMERPAQRDSSELAYIMFTSGSTGMPKGVMVSVGAVRAYLDDAEKWTDLDHDDRFAEAHDITFDLSVHNMIMAWKSGAALYVMSALDMMAPHAFIRRHHITAWLSVPTIINNLRRGGRLKAGQLPSLRHSLFCGEPLSEVTALAWAEAAPNSIVENIYGPTECTIACTRQTIVDPLPVTPERQMVSIGLPFEKVDVAIWGQDRNPLDTNQVGEIMLAGPQLAEGYLNAPQKTAKAFETVNGKRWYHTGDLGYRDAEGLFHHMGRIDNQIKMKGNRIELEEVETHLRRACGTPLSAVVAWPILEGIPQGLVGFTTASDKSEAEIQNVMKETLPEYMVPARIVVCEDLPRNTSDKIDRGSLRAMLDAPSLETPVANHEKVMA